MSRVDIIRFCSGTGFSMTEQALEKLGRLDVLNNLNNLEEALESSAPVLVIPTAGTWNFGSFETGDHHALQLASKYLPMVQSLPGFRVCFDCGGEGFSFHIHLHNYISARFSELKLNVENTFILTSRLNAQAEYEDWCEKQGCEIAFQFLYSPVQLYFCAGIHRNELSLGSMEQTIRSRSPFGSAGRSIRRKNYLCLNFSPREGRYACVLELFDRSLQDRGLISFYGRSVDNGPDDPPPSIEQIGGWLRMISVDERLIAQIPALEALCPLTLDDPTSDRAQKAYGVANQDFYESTYFSFVTESDFMGQAGSRFTEKVLKPIANLHPFIVLGTHGVLAELRRLGFKTFEGLIDERYDDIQDASDRLKAAMREVVRLASMSLEEAHGLYERAWPILVHNYLHFLMVSPDLVDIDSALKKLSA